MKKYLALLAAIILLVTVAGAAKAEAWALGSKPEIIESDEPVSFKIDKIIKVDLDWEKVYNNDTIGVYAFMPYSAENIVAVILTDGFQFVHGIIDTAGYGALAVTFKTEHIRKFVMKSGYLIFIGNAE